MRRGAVSMVFALGALTSSARAQPTAIRVEYQAPASCPAAGAFLAEVQARTPRARAARPDEPARTFSLRAQEQAGAYVATLRSESSDVREVQGKTCAEVISALALTAALTIDPEALSAEPRPPEPEPPPLRRWLIGAGVEVFRAALPAAGGLSLVLGRSGPARFPPSLRLSLRYLRQASLPDSARVQLHLAAAGAEACPFRLGADLAIEPCLRMESGTLVGRGRELDNPDTGWAFWLAATAALRASFTHRGGLGVELEGSLTAPLVRPKFVREAPREVVAEVKPIGYGAALRAVYRFP